VVPASDKINALLYSEQHRSKGMSKGMEHGRDMGRGAGNSWIRKRPGACGKVESKATVQRVGRRGHAPAQDQ